MLTCQSFFGSLPRGHEALFESDQPVWHALKKLKDYLQALPPAGTARRGGERRAAAPDPCPA